MPTLADYLNYGYGPEANFGAKGVGAPTSMPGSSVNLGNPLATPINLPPAHVMDDTAGGGTVETGGGGGGGAGVLGLLPLASGAKLGYNMLQGDSLGEAFGKSGLGKAIGWAGSKLGLGDLFGGSTAAQPIASGATSGYNLSSMPSISDPLGAGGAAASGAAKKSISDWLTTGGTWQSRLPAAGATALAGPLFAELTGGSWKDPATLISSGVGAAATLAGVNPIVGGGLALGASLLGGNLLGKDSPPSLTLKTAPSVGDDFQGAAAQSPFGYVGARERDTKKQDNDTIGGFTDGIAALDRQAASYMTPDEIKRVSQHLQKVQGVTEKGNINYATLIGDRFKDIYDALGMDGRASQARYGNIEDPEKRAQALLAELATRPWDKAKKAAPAPAKKAAPAPVKKGKSAPAPARAAPTKKAKAAPAKPPSATVKASMARKVPTTNLTVQQIQDQLSGKSSLSPEVQDLMRRLAGGV